MLPFQCGRQTTPTVRFLIGQAATYAMKKIKWVRNLRMMREAVWDWVVTEGIPGDETNVGAEGLNEVREQAK